MRIVAYLRVSTNNQDLDQQRLAILDYAHRNRLTIDDERLIGLLGWRFGRFLALLGLLLSGLLFRGGGLLLFALLRCRSLRFDFGRLGSVFLIAGVGFDFLFRG